MCGLAGFLSTGAMANDVPGVLAGMGEAIRNRGPDGSGHWFDEILSVGLVHRRLAIQDLSPSGAQPMESASGRYVIAFNGEIYNFRILRDELKRKGSVFRGHSDTEVMLAAFDAWGFTAALHRFSGMFAFALVDRHEKTLFLTRDRMGEKPLYYGWQRGTFLFGSELKALSKHPDWQGNINVDALSLLLRHNVIPAPHSIYKEVFKCPPAHYLAIDLSSGEQGLVPEPSRYWDPKAFLETNLPSLLDRSSAADQLEQVLDEVIQEQMISDVPLGAFLSGGVDSSTIAAMMQKHTSSSVRTFSIGFKEPEFNEAEYAKAVAMHLGTKHTELYVTPEDALRVIPRLSQCYDEPFADSSQIPTYLVSEMTSQHVTVALSGDGGDELFCGYSRYPAMVRAWQNRHSASALLRRGVSMMPQQVGALLARIAPSQRDRSLLAIQRSLKIQREINKAESMSEYYRQKVSFWPDPEWLLRQSAELPYGLTDQLPASLEDDSLGALMWRDLNWYLPDDILTKVDRAAMAHSLETRIPLLDRRVVEFALSLPASWNMEAGDTTPGKQVLRDVLYRHVPRNLIERPKQGFAVPVGPWLRGPLRDWAEELLDEKRLVGQGYWHADRVRWVWQEHLSKRENYAYELWGILMFQAWLDESRRPI